MEKLAPLSVDQLYRTCDSELLPFKTTDNLEGYSGFFGQERAIEAMEFGVGMVRPGYNLFVMGTPHTGRFSFAMENLRSAAKKQNKPNDWCYLKNIADTRYPKALKLPAGKGVKLQRDLSKLLSRAITELPAAFENPTYQRQKSTIERDFARLYDAAVEVVERKGREYSIAVYRDAGTIGFTPVAEGQAIDEAVFSALPEEIRDAFNLHISELEELLNEQLTEMPRWRREAADALRYLDRDTARHTLVPLFDEVRAEYSNLSGVNDYLNDVEHDLIRNAGEMVADGIFENKSEAARREFMNDNYGLNLLVDNERTKGAPVVYEAHPSYENLFGRVEYNSEMGAMVTNYRLIRSGALHRANGGYLVIEAEKLLEQPFVYQALKRALKAHEIRIENPASEFTGITTVTLSPEPIGLNVKLVLIGGRDIYYLLQDLDHDFEKMFRVVVDFEEDVPRTDATIRQYARLMSTLANEEKLAPLKREGVARLVEHSSRLAGDQDMLSAHIGELKDLLCEADYRRDSVGDKYIDAHHVDAALAAKERRTGRLAQKIHEGITNETVLIDTDGEAIGKSNGLTVLQVGDVSFGTPARITATVHPGSRGIVDIEREVTLGQPIHSKGVLILSGYLGHRYAKDFPLAISASIAMEQSYGYIDGDSASMAEICTLISALTHIPIKQQFAMTGSINQYGEVQAIGGVNEKIEGFFRLCETRGLTGRQGVIIPQANVRHLMLKQEVVDAVREGLFSIYSVATVDQALELLMGIDAGKEKADGVFNQRSIGAEVVKRLREMAKAKA